ncbi:copper chaperone CopZ [Aquibacillus koreensis]|uniref:Copper chaperone CopZ n=1 Tax=Aquibacillus koreensis TaxID=279446 RepID=A0A9X3WR79_9BACI|nr:copper chaperone CopZ [Aquibacillus koreensis]MCT2536098.1 copper chaperone CopZ [Aquibacillus koreensis]MDC3422796.1 copper chaperone CopZ [Aquibacillus koreensis]
MKNITLEVKGMTCGHCKSAVNGALEELAGVERVEVNLETGKVEVGYDESKVDENKLKEAVEEQGYDVA